MPIKRLAARSLVIAWLIPFCAGPNAAAEPAPMLTDSPPAYLQAGRSRELDLSGQYLSSAASIVVSEPRGLEASLLKSDKPSDGHVRIRLAADAGAEPGDREMRLVAPDGVSNAIVVTVGAFAAVEEKEPNNTRDQAQAVRLPAEILGRVNGAGDVDQFRFSATKGQHLLFNARVARFGSPLEPVLVIKDASTGREFPTTVEQHGRDPLLVFDPPVNGNYILEVRDLRYRGGPNFIYHIEAGELPYLEAVLPMSGPRGKAIELQAIGHNLQGGEKISVDLSHALLGRIMVRAHTTLGPSNEVPFEVTEVPATVPVADNHTIQFATTVPIPTDVSGRLAKAGQEDFYRFHVSNRQPVRLTVMARPAYSPLDALFALRNANGDILEMTNGSPGVDPLIRRDLDPGDYIACVRDLGYGGGDNYLYRLQLRGGNARKLPAELSVRFLPDAVRIHRGGNAPLWCEIRRPPDFNGNVTVQLDGLPAGITCNPAVMSESTSGLFTISANSQAPLGSFPVRLKVSEVVHGQSFARYAEPEVAGRVRQQAYLTVLEAAPFAIAPFAYSPQSVRPFASEIATLTKQVNGPDDGLDAAQAEWEKQTLAAPTWTVIDPETVTTSSGAKLIKQPDGSLLLSGAVPVKETYTIMTRTAMKGINAFRLEAIADPSLPGHGPGAAGNGNFVLDEFKVTQARGASAPEPIRLKLATADFSQSGFAVQNAIDNNPGTGWAVSPEFGKDHAAVFTTAAPAGGDGETSLSFVLDQQTEYAQHLLGRFRISVTTADPASLPKQSVPEPILAILHIKADQRTAQQKAMVMTAFRQNDPQVLARQARLQSLQQLMAPWDELRQTELVLARSTPALAAEQAKWEKTPAAQAAPVPTDIIAIVKKPVDLRTEPEIEALSAYFRFIAPSLQPQRERAAQLQAQLGAGPMLAVRGKASTIAVILVRKPDFRGDVEVTLDGFSAGRDPATQLPTPASKNLKFMPLMLSGDITFGALALTPEAGSELGTRQVVLQAKAKIGTDGIVESSAAFALTVGEK